MRQTAFLFVLLIAMGCRQHASTNTTQPPIQAQVNPVSQPKPQSQSKLDSSFIYTHKPGDSTVITTKSFDIFIRWTNKKLISAGMGDVPNNELWIKHKPKGNEELLVASVQSDSMELLIGDIFDVELSADSQSAYFESDCWATSGSIHVVNMKTKQEHFVCDGNSLDVITEGRYKGNLVVNQHRYRQNGDGAYDWFYVINPKSGKSIKTLGEEVKPGALR